MNRLIVMSVLWIFGGAALYSLTLDLEKIYPLLEEKCVFRGCGYIGSRILDLSDQGLESIEGIDLLLVRYKDKIMAITEIENLAINLNNNNLRRLPLKIMKLKIVSLHLSNNPHLCVDEYIKKQLNNTYFYISNKD